eukprot:scaffold35648_cov237-Amphora_coffeaeformis.AAC.1
MPDPVILVRTDEESFSSPSFGSPSDEGDDVTILPRSLMVVGGSVGATVGGTIPRQHVSAKSIVSWVQKDVSVAAAAKRATSRHGISTSNATRT